jgi:hypothetical protein
MAYLSDDLSGEEHARVEGHLALCSPCNQRYLALCSKMQQVRDVLSEGSILGPQQVEQARQRFFARYAEWEFGNEAERAPGFTALSRRWNAAAPLPLAIAAGIVCAAALAAWLFYRAPQIQAQEVLAQTLRQDNLGGREGPVHQEFEIEIRQVKPAPERRSGILSVWYDARGERFAGRWERDDGQLQYAIWRPERDREFVYNAALGTSAVARVPQTGQTITLGELSFEEASLEQLEDGFLEWLANRRWEPISIASDVNLFQRRDGVQMEVELLQSDAGRCYRITARRPAGWGVIELVAEVDAATYRPSIEMLRLVTTLRVVELRLRARRAHWPVQGNVEKAVFWPSVRIEGEMEVSDLRRPTGPRQKSSVAGAASPHPTVEQLDLLEMRARYALHQAGACLGEPVRVERIGGRLVQVEGLVESAGRKNELLARLAGLSPSPFVGIEINTVEEALQKTGAPAGSGSPGQTDDGSGPGERLEVIATGSPIREALEGYLRESQAPAVSQDPSRNPADLQELAAQFSRQVISASLANMTEAWALRRLAERYGAPGSASLSTEASALLRRMLADHVSGLIARTGGIQKQVRPLLATLVAEHGVNAPPAGVDDSSNLAGMEHWAAQSRRVFEEIESAEGVTSTLFADSGYANGARRDSSPERAAAALLQALPRLENRLRSLEQSLNAQDRRIPDAGRSPGNEPPRNLP